MLLEITNLSKRFGGFLDLAAGATVFQSASERMTSAPSADISVSESCSTCGPRWSNW